MVNLEEGKFYKMAYKPDLQPDLFEPWETYFKVEKGALDSKDYKNLSNLYCYKVVEYNPKNNTFRYYSEVWLMGQELNDENNYKVEEIPVEDYLVKLRLFMDDIKRSIDFYESFSS